MASETEHTKHEQDPALTVKTEVYEGPLEVLLELIQKRKLFISDISLTQVTDDFLRYIEAHESFPVETSTQFLETASTLMLLKSKSLLPNLDLSEEEEGDIQELEERLALYQRIKELSKHVNERWGVAPMANRARRSGPVPVFSPTDELHLETLYRVMRTVLCRLPRQQDLPQTQVSQTVSLKETIDRLHERMQYAMRDNFSALAGYSKGKAANKEERLHVVVHFLAMLELVKSGIMEVEQRSPHDDIVMERTEIDVSRYE